MLDEKNALSHYEVVVGYEPNKKQLLLLDPARGWQVDSFEGFAKEWAVSKGVTIVTFPDSGAGTTGSVAAESAATIAPPVDALPSVTAARRASALAVILLVVVIILLL